MSHYCRHRGNFDVDIGEVTHLGSTQRTTYATLIPTNILVDLTGEDFISTQELGIVSRDGWICNWKAVLVRVMRKDGRLMAAYRIEEAA